MKIFPAVDILGGKAVRLTQGDYGTAETYCDPLEAAQKFRADGAKFLHVVDLDGAKAKRPVNTDAVKQLLQAGLFTQVGGGIRTEQTVKQYLDAGVSRVILGTSATDLNFVKRLTGMYGDRIAAGVDCRDGYAAVNGWTESTKYKAEDFCLGLKDAGITTIILTDISRDGAMRGIDADFYAEISKKTGLNIIASGGVSSIDDVKALCKNGVYGAIIGKALYKGAIDLKEALVVSEE